MTTIKINLRNNLITQYSDHNFNSMCMFQGKRIAIGEDGVFQLGCADKDIYTASTDERDIDAWFEYPISALGVDVGKKLRRLYVRGEFTGGMQITAVTGGHTDESTTYDITPNNTGNVQHTVKVRTNSSQRDEHWSFIVNNVLGADFSIDAIDATMIPMTRKRNL